MTCGSHILPASDFITRIVNIPIELVHSSFDIFMGFSTINRDIILNYLNLGEEYKDIYDILSKEL